jgi:hypothetical protein
MVDFLGQASSADSPSPKVKTKTMGKLSGKWKIIMLRFRFENWQG